jgi:hypothetical protein
LVLLLAKNASSASWAMGPASNPTNRCAQDACTRQVGKGMVHEPDYAPGQVRLIPNGKIISTQDLQLIEEVILDSRGPPVTQAVFTAGESLSVCQFKRLPFPWHQFNKGENRCNT